MFVHLAGIPTLVCLITWEAIPPQSACFAKEFHGWDTRRQHLDFQLD
jgi:hypothetical protein